VRLTERVSKRIDFARERSAQGRSLNTAVRELAGADRAVAAATAVYSASEFPKEGIATLMSVCWSCQHVSWFLSVDAAEYLQEGMSQADHVLLDFDHKEIVLGERRVNPPRLQGVSGGGVFHISRETKLGPFFRNCCAKSTQFPAHCGNENQAFPGDGP